MIVDQLAGKAYTQLLRPVRAGGPTPMDVLRPRWQTPASRVYEQAPRRYLV